MAVSFAENIARRCYSWYNASIIPFSKEDISLYISWEPMGEPAYLATPDKKKGSWDWLPRISSCWLIGSCWLVSGCWLISGLRLALNNPSSTTDKLSCWCCSLDSATLYAYFLTSSFLISARSAVLNLKCVWNHRSTREDVRLARCDCRRELSTVSYSI